MYFGRGKHKKRSFRRTQHNLFWSLSLIILLFYFRTGSDQSGTGITMADAIYTLWFHISLVGVVYINTLVLIPRFLPERKYVYYALFFILDVLMFSALNDLLFRYLIDYVFPGYYFISYYNYFDLLIFHLVYATLSSLLKLSKSYFRLLETRNRIIQLEKEKNRTELMALKAQINPHFMFNSLNNIYALALKSSSSTPEMILLLSDLLRYIIYDTSRDFVPLKEELKMVDDYIKLQKIRAGKDASIDFQISGNTEKKRIAPLIFLPLIENVFKHGIKHSLSSSYANITFNVLENHLHVEMINSIENGEQEAENSKGIGLENVRKRLELIYPEKHELNINASNKQYTLSLKIEDLKDERKDKNIAMPGSG